MALWKSNEKEWAISVKCLLGLLYDTNGLYKKAINCYKNTIKLSKKFAKNNIGLQFECYLHLGRSYFDLGKQEKIVKIIKIVEKMEFLINNKAGFHGNIGWLYFFVFDLDKSIHHLWIAIKLSEKHRKHLWYYALWINYFVKNDIEKAYQMIYNMKSCLGVTPVSNMWYIVMQHSLMQIHLNTMRHQEALECYEIIKNQCSGNLTQEIKLEVGMIYMNTLDYDKALEIFIEIKDTLQAYPEAHKSFKFVINAFIGEIYKCKNDNNNAYSYFIQAFNLINYIDHCELDMGLGSFILTARYFYNKSEYNKSELILNKALKLSENKLHDKTALASILIFKAKLYYATNETSKANFCFNEVEKIMNIKEILLDPQKHMKSCYIKELSSLVNIVDIYIDSYSQENYQKAEKILKFLEDFYSEKFVNDWLSKLNIYKLFGNLYYQQARWNESKIYYEKTLSLLKQDGYDAMLVKHLNKRIKHADRKIAIEQSKS